MVRRLKSDIRELEGGFPKRNVVQIDIAGLPEETPELVLASKLDAYRTEREMRLSGETRSQQTAAALVIGGLQKRLLSSVEAFARTLAVHRRSVEAALREAAAAKQVSPAVIADLAWLTLDIDSDDTISEMTDDESELDEGDHASASETLDPADLDLDTRMATATAASSDAGQPDKRAALERELAMVNEMRDIAEAGRYDPDSRVARLIEWIGANMCPGLLAGIGESPEWNDRRVLIFTEYEDTRRYIERCLAEAISHTEGASERIATFTGATSRQRREEIKHAFNTEPRNHRLRILIATDAAREGLNLQRHCHDLFHFDLPWNPGRLDQRNGRIDRKLQPADEVFCHYFVYQQRPEDRVLQVLVRKAERIREELGSVAKVLEARIAERIGKEGMRRDKLDELANAIQNAATDDRRGIVEDELEEARSRQEKLKEEVEGLRNRLQRSQQHIGITAPQFRQTLSMSLRLAGAPAITAIDPDQEPVTDVPHTFLFPAASDALARDPGWTTALDALRDPRRRGETLGDWRRRASARPVVFEDSGRLGENVVHLHLQHRVAQRLLGRFVAQGLIHHDLSKACLTAASDAVPRVILLGRLAVYGPRAARLHEEIVPVTARWVEPSQRNTALTPYGRTTEQAALASLQASLDEAGRHSIPEEVRARLAASAQSDIADLLPHLRSRGAELLEEAKARLSDRAEAESRSMIALLQGQRMRIGDMVGSGGQQLPLDFDQAELRQLEADRRAWARRLGEIESELESEPRRIADAYTVRAHRVDPLGLVYLWPRMG